MDDVTHTIGSETTNATSVDASMAERFKNLRATSGTVTFGARWKADLVDYHVEHYLQELDGSYPGTPKTIDELS